MIGHENTTGAGTSSRGLGTEGFVVCVVLAAPVSHPTVGILVFGESISDRLGSLTADQPVSMIILRVFLLED